MPYGRAMNSNLPDEKPMFNFLFSFLFNPCRARNAPILSAIPIGPPLQKILITALPTSIFFVLENIWCANWKKSVQSPTSPCQWGITGFLLDF